MTTWNIKENLKTKLSHAYRIHTWAKRFSCTNTLPRISQPNEIPALKQLARFYFRREDLLISVNQSACTVIVSNQLEIARVDSFKKMYETGFPKLYLISMVHLNCFNFVYLK